MDQLIEVIGGPCDGTKVRPDSDKKTIILQHHTYDRFGVISNTRDVEYRINRSLGKAFENVFGDKS